MKWTLRRILFSSFYNTVLYYLKGYSPSRRILFNKNLIYKCWLFRKYYQGSYLEYYLNRNILFPTAYMRFLSNDQITFLINWNISDNLPKLISRWIFKSVQTKIPGLCNFIDRAVTGKRLTTVIQFNLKFNQRASSRLFEREREREREKKKEKEKKITTKDWKQRNPSALCRQRGGVPRRFNNNCLSG